MRYKRLAIALITMIVLCGTSCAARKQFRVESLEFREVEGLKVQEVQESKSLRDSVVVVVHDTVRVVTTITINTNEAGDTTFKSVVTDRVTVRDRELRVESVELRVVDSLELKVENVKDSVFIKSEEVLPAGKRNGFVAALKWIAIIVIEIIVFIIFIKIIKH